ncbi:MAG: ATP-binding protein [Candidatus Faecisoma sp.]|nr:ATP-binding protein [Acholeplasma sp.]MDY2892371.1 ATP-binding protein [Candidatus Faecisoma sp.]
MLGTIIGIEENQVLLKLAIDVENFNNLINIHVVMEEGNRKIVGEIINIKEGIAYINLLGEIINNNFVFGVIVKPAFSSTVKLISKEKIPMIIGVENYKENQDLYLGVSPIYEGVKIGVNINRFFSNHFAILGSTGSGKSCGVARIIQNIFDKRQYVPYKASLFIFDAYGEYHSAFKDIDKINPDISFKAYTTNTNFSDTDVLKIPLWLLDVDDIALLLGADRPSQLPIIEKAIKLVNIFAREGEDVIKYKNDIIARAILDIFASGNPPAQIRDQVFSVLSFYNTSQLNLETPIIQPGYTRPLKQCLLIDATGKIREMELLTNFMQTFLEDDLKMNYNNGDIKYNLDDLKSAFEFALISEGVLNNDRVYEESNVLKVRLQSLVNGNYKVYFDCNKYMTKEQYIKELLTATNGHKAQIINFNINYVDDRFAKVVTKIYSKMLFNFAKENENRGTLPFHIILEEAHRYVQNDNDYELLGYNIFDRITKEGRKYGVILGLISQRPSELSETSLSQCNNFLIFKMLHPIDVEYIRKMVPNITNEIVKQLRILQPGNCIAFGNGFKVPVFIKMEMPNPAPSSSSCDISGVWFIKRT